MECIAKKKKKTNSPVRRKYRLIAKETNLEKSFHNNNEVNDFYKIRRKSEFSSTYGQFSTKYVDI